MRKLVIPISLGLMCASFTIIPVAKTTHSPFAAAAVSHLNITGVNKSMNAAGAGLYQATSLQDHGLSEEAFSYAWKGYQKLLLENKLNRTNFLTICDFSQSSRSKRLYIIDVANEQLVINTYVAHGKNSGAEYATRFSNRPASLQSSLGFYITSQTYIGEHGLSLRINGVDPGFNDQAMARAIVIHGAAYLGDARARSGLYMGRSWGCPAVPQQESAKIITTIKNGTCLFIYHPGKAYLLGSKILNG